MSTATLPTKPKTPAPAPLASEPPPETFWEKWSPNYEFQISSVATGAVHVIVVALVIYITTRLMKTEEVQPVPVRSITVADASIGGDGGEQGSGGGDPKVEATDQRQPEQPREIPQLELDQRIASVKKWDIALKDNPALIESLAKSPNFEKYSKVNEKAREELAKGFNRKPGEGENPGAGASGETGPGSGGKGGPGAADSSGRRSSRWSINFRTTSGADYLKQLAFFEARLLIPEPPDWKTNRYFDDLTTPNAGKPQGDVALPGMNFIDDGKGSAQKIAQALGLEIAPPYFIAFFPKKVEDELAAKERAYRNRKEEQIRSTTFSVVERNGSYEIKVIDQVPVRR